jgi:hypothetical protein
MYAGTAVYPALRERLLYAYGVPSFSSGEV